LRLTTRHNANGRHLRRGAHDNRALSHPFERRARVRSPALHSRPPKYHTHAPFRVATAAQGATFTPLNATQWQIHSGLDGHNEIITLANGAAVHASDFVFV
jgi:hypothetical protein